MELPETMNELNPSKIFGLSQFAYLARSLPIGLLQDQLGRELPFVAKESVKIITATSGLITPASSGLGLMAELNGGRTPCGHGAVCRAPE